MSLTLDKPSYRIRETADLVVNLSNVGNFQIVEGSVSVSVPAIGFDDIKVISLSPKQNKQLSFSVPIPELSPSGVHEMIVSFRLPSGSMLSEAKALIIPPAALAIG